MPAPILATAALSQNQQQPRNSQGGGGFAIMVIIGLLVVAGIMVFVYFYWDLFGGILSKDEGELPYKECRLLGDRKKRKDDDSGEEDCMSGCRLPGADFDQICLDEAGRGYAARTLTGSHGTGCAHGQDRVICSWKFVRNAGVLTDAEIADRREEIGVKGAKCVLNSLYNWPYHVACQNDLGSDFVMKRITHEGCIAGQSKAICGRKSEVLRWDENNAHFKGCDGNKQRIHIPCVDSGRDGKGKQVHPVDYCNNYTGSVFRKGKTGVMLADQPIVSKSRLNPQWTEIFVNDPQCGGTTESTGGPYYSEGDAHLKGCDAGDQKIHSMCKTADGSWWGTGCTINKDAGDKVYINNNWFNSESQTITRKGEKLDDHWWEFFVADPKC
jgi:hypothetical protein